MSKKPRKKKIGNKRSLVSAEVRNSAYNSIWIESGTHTEESALHATTGFKTAHLMEAVRPDRVQRVKSNKTVAIGRGVALDAFKHLDSIVVRKAIEKVRRSENNYAIISIAVQTDGDKVWYDTEGLYDPVKKLVGGKVMNDQLDDMRAKLIRNINDRYLVAVSTFIFTDMSIDLNNMGDNLFEYLETKDILNKEKQLLGMQERFRYLGDDVVEQVKELGDWDNLGKLIHHYYLNLKFD